MKHIAFGAAALSFSASMAVADTTVRSCNRTVTFDAPPERAVSNDVNLTEMMLVLGLADRMIGYTGISGWKTLDEEMTAGVEELPELELRHEGRRRSNARNARTLRRAGLRTHRVLYPHHGNRKGQHRHDVC